MVEHTCNPSTQKTEAIGLWVQDQEPWLYSLALHSVKKEKRKENREREREMRLKQFLYQRNWYLAVYESRPRVKEKLSPKVSLLLKYLFASVSFKCVDHSAMLHKHYTRIFGIVSF